jgi:hypothetical protein
MRCFWEQTGVLGPIYQSLGQGLNDSQIAKKLGLTEMNVQNCIAWVLHFLKLKDRQELGSIRVNWSVALLARSMPSLVLRGSNETPIFVAVSVLMALVGVTNSRSGLRLDGPGSTIRLHTFPLVERDSKERKLQVCLQNLPHCTTAFWCDE